MSGAITGIGLSKTTVVSSDMVVLLFVMSCQLGARCARFNDFTEATPPGGNVGNKAEGLYIAVESGVND
jgi:hypothetical protein